MHCTAPSRCLQKLIFTSVCLANFRISKGTGRGTQPTFFTTSMRTPQIKKTGITESRSIEPTHNQPLNAQGLSAGGLGDGAGAASATGAGGDGEGPGWAALSAASADGFGSAPASFGASVAAAGAGVSSLGVLAAELVQQHAPLMLGLSRVPSLQRNTNVKHTQKRAQTTVRCIAFPLYTSPHTDQAARHRLCTAFVSPYPQRHQHNNMSHRFLGCLAYHRWRTYT